MNTGKCMATCAFLVTYLVRLPTTGLARNNFRFAVPCSGANGIEDFTYVLILCVSIGLENTLATRSTVTIPSQRIGHPPPFSRSGCPRRL